MVANEIRSLRLALPKGRLEKSVRALLLGAGIRLGGSERGYRPEVLGFPAEAKLLKPANVVEMLQTASRDAGFCGTDLVEELGAELVLVMDTGLDPVRIVAAAPPELLVDGELPERRLRLATEYEQLTRKWLSREGIDAQIVRSFGATEVFPPEDADLIVDNCATGSTLAANGLEIIAELASSTTGLFASREAGEDPKRRSALEELALLLGAVLEARRRAFVEINVSAADLETLVSQLPSLREPTVAPLHGGCGYAVKVALPRSDLPRLIPLIRRCGGSDIVVTSPTQIVR